MQITCSKCKKVYNVDSNRIPGGVTVTRCKACGNSISLRPAAPPKPAQPKPAQPKAAAMQITCQYCSKKYSINPQSIPAGVTSIKCKACSHAIALKPKTAAPPPRPAAAKTAGPDSDVREIVCLYCGKKYRINAGKIPPGVTTTKCRDCGRNLSLLPPAALTSAFKDEIAKKATPLKSPAVPKDQQTAPVRIIQTLEPLTLPMWRKPWVLAAAAAVVFLCFGLYYTGSKLTQSAKLKIRAESAIKTEREGGAIAGPEPVVAAQFNVPRLLEAIDQNFPEDKKDFKYKMAAAIFKSFGLRKVELYLYPDSQQPFLPVIVAEGETGKNLEKQLRSQAKYARFLERLSDGSYTIKKEALPQDKQNDFPIDLYRLQFSDNIAILAPQPIARLFVENENPLAKSQVAQMMASIAGPQDLAVLSLRIPENFIQDWQNKIRANAALRQNPQIAMMAAMADGIMARVSEPLKGVESLAVGFRLDDTNGRQLNYAQQFRKGVDGHRIYRQLKSGNPVDLHGNGIVLKLVELLNDPHYHHDIYYEKNRLRLELGWEKQHDKTFLTALSEATLGQLFAQGMDLTPSEGPITVQYVEPPRLSTDVEVNQLKRTIADAVQQSLLPGSYLSLADEPRMTLKLDTVDFPNASLAQLTYEVLEVLTGDGTNVLRAEESQLQAKINPGSVSPGTIDLNVEKGTAAEALKTAKIRFQLSIPASFKKVEFASGNLPGTLKESEGVQVKLEQLENDVARVTYRGGTSAHLFAFDKTGRSLAPRESQSSSSAEATRFQGRINTLMVVVVQQVLDYPFEVNVDINGGKGPSLSRQTENPKRQ
jgi:DNA-directed RNA polymerase subunit RPC12/RpoP